MNKKKGREKHSNHSEKDKDIENKLETVDFFATGAKLTFIRRLGMLLSNPKKEAPSWITGILGASAIFAIAYFLASYF